MEIKCNTNTFYHNNYDIHPPKPKEIDFQRTARLERMPESVDIFCAKTDC